MTPQLALLGCYVFILWLFFNDWRRHPGISSALWIPLAWGFILGSKPISLWFGGDGSATTDDYIEGSPVDRLFFLLLIAAAFGVVLKRQVNWSHFFRNNKWLCYYFIFIGASAVWSDYPFVSFKRWVKDVGNILMVLVVLTEPNPVVAVKALLGRCAYLLVPLSLVFIKYFPELGRYYNRWPPYNVYFGGVTTDKNLLGMALFVCGLSLCWIVLSMWDLRKASRDNSGLLGVVALGLMTIWLLLRTDSSTALATTILGCAFMLALGNSWIRDKIRRFGTYFVLSIGLLLVLHLAFNLGGLLVGLLGRDLTFTGRTEIWEAVLKEDVNPLLGTGFYSFWLGDRVERLSEKYFYHLNEAHNGYLETYLNTGLIGLLLLVGMLASAYRNTRRAAMTGSRYGALRFAFLMAMLIYNLTEATFDRLNLLWFALLMLIIEYAQPRKIRRKEPEASEPRFGRDPELQTDIHPFELRMGWSRSLRLAEAMNCQAGLLWPRAGGCFSKGRFRLGV